MPEKSLAETIDGVMGSQFTHFAHPFEKLKKAVPVSSGDANRFLALKFLPPPKMLGNSNYSAKIAYYRQVSGGELTATEKIGRRLPASIVWRHGLNPFNWPLMVLNIPAASLNFMRQKILLAIDKRDLLEQEAQREKDAKIKAEELKKEGVNPHLLVKTGGIVSKVSPDAYRRKVMVTIAFYPFEMLAAIPQFLGALVTGLAHGAGTLGSNVYHRAKGDLEKSDFRASTLGSARPREGYQKVSRDSQNDNEIELAGEASKNKSSEPEREPSQPSQEAVKPSKADAAVETPEVAAEETKPLLAESSAPDSMPEEVPKQPQHCGSIAMVLAKLEPEVVSGEVPAPAFDEVFEDSVPKLEVAKVVEDSNGEGKRESEGEAREDGNGDSETVHF